MDKKKLFWDIVDIHKGKVIGTLTGLLFGLLTIIFGFWKASFLAICILIGYLIGKRIDENQDFKNMLKKFWTNF
ncbi:MAG: DUF2273 domain-containing protein [Bacillota bacterium]